MHPSIICLGHYSYAAKAQVAKCGEYLPFLRFATLTFVNISPGKPGALAPTGARGVSIIAMHTCFAYEHSNYVTLRPLGERLTSAKLMLAAYAALFVALQRINSSIGPKGDPALVTRCFATCIALLAFCPKGKHIHCAKHCVYVTLGLHNCYAHLLSK